MIQYSLKRLIQKNQLQSQFLKISQRGFNATPQNTKDDQEEKVEEVPPVVENQIVPGSGGIGAYFRLARMNSQIGTHLLLVPSLWGIMLGAPGYVPCPYTMGLFTAGAIGARSAGCVINDLADRDIDKHVDRTQARPLTTGEISPTQAKVFLSGLMAMNFGILFQLPMQTIALGCAVTPLVFAYPYAKRSFKYPQVVLGTTFNFGIMMGYAAVATGNAVNWQVCLPYYAGAIMWTTYYDSIYAMQDREFDKKLGLNSTAILIENNPKLALGALAAGTVGMFAAGGAAAGFGMYYQYGLGVLATQFAIQVLRVDINNKKRCMRQFKNNRYIGLTLLLAIFVGKFFVFRNSIVAYEQDPETGKYPLPINYENNIAIIEKHLSDSVEQKYVQIFSWSWCPFTKKTCKLLKEQGIPFKVVKSDLQEDNFNFQNAVVYKSENRKVPNVWIDGKKIGGNAVIQEHFKNGELQKIIEDAGIKHNMTAENAYDPVKHEQKKQMGLWWLKKKRPEIKQPTETTEQKLEEEPVKK